MVGPAALVPLAGLEPADRRALLTGSYDAGVPRVFPDYLTILLTNRCPLRCRACATHDWARRNHDRELSAADWCEVVSQAARLGADKLMISGGEPLLRREDCRSILRHASQLGMRTALMTSARGLDEELLLALYDDGLNELSTSLDGPTARVHDGWRGRAGSFDEVLAALAAVRELRGRPRARAADHARAHDWSSHVMCVIAGHNARFLSATLTRARNAGADLVSFQCLSPDERFADNTVPVDEIEELAGEIEALLLAREKGAGVSNDPAFLNQVVPYFQGRLEVLDDRCLAGYAAFILAPDGSVSSCRESLSRTARLRTDAGDIDLEAMWRGDQMGAARAAMVGCERRCLLRCWVDGT